MIRERLDPSDRRPPLHDSPPAIRLAVGIDDPRREQLLLQVIEATGEFVATEQCLSAVELVDVVRHDRVDAVLVGAGLHRLSPRTIADMGGARMPMVVLAPDPDAPHWSHPNGIVLGPSAQPEQILEALREVLRRPHAPAPIRGTETGTDRIPTLPATARVAECTVYTFAGGPNSPGRTTISEAVATTLSSREPTILVEADLAGARLDARLDADPERNLYVLATHSTPRTPAQWERELAWATQPLSRHSPHGSLLCGIPKPEMRRAVTTSFFRDLVGQLRRRYRYVVIDTGEDLLGIDTEMHRLAVELADEVVLIVSADVEGLREGRKARRLLLQQLGVTEGRLSIVVNKYDRRHHAGKPDIEEAMEQPVAAYVPWDYEAVERARAAQQSVMLGRNIALRREILSLAERAHGGRIDTSLDSAQPADRFRWLRARRPRRTGRQNRPLLAPGDPPSRPPGHAAQQTPLDAKRSDGNAAPSGDDRRAGRVASTAPDNRAPQRRELARFVDRNGSGEVVTVEKEIIPAAVRRPNHGPPSIQREERAMSEERQQPEDQKQASAGSAVPSFVAASVLVEEGAPEGAPDVGNGSCATSECSQVLTSDPGMRPPDYDLRRYTPHPAASPWQQATRWLRKRSHAVRLEEEHDARIRESGSLLDVGSRILPFISSKGGVGKTSTSLALGQVLAQVEGANPKLCEVNPDFANIDQLLGGAPKGRTIEHLLEHTEEVQRGGYTALRGYLTQWGRLDVLLAPGRPEVMERMSPREYQQAIDILCWYSQYILLDCGTAPTQPLNRYAISRAHHVVFLSRPENATMVPTLEAIDYVAGLRYPRNKVRALRETTLVVNDCGFGGRDPVDVGRVRAALPEVNVQVLPHSPRLRELLDDGALDIGNMPADYRRAIKGLLASVMQRLAETQYRGALGVENGAG